GDEQHEARSRQCPYLLLGHQRTLPPSLNRTNEPRQPPRWLLVQGLRPQRAPSHRDEDVLENPPSLVSDARPTQRRMRPASRPGGQSPPSPRVAPPRSRFYL